ncbi:Phosphoenolpyruvate carboxylase [Arachis hypogaea]|nr:Phosphoenolpyruvate carboxylase [Arachis hypogaea]
MFLKFYVRAAQIVSDLCGTCSEVIAKFSVKPMIQNCLSQLYAKDVTTPDDKQELDEALQQEVDVRKDLIRNFANTIDLDQLDI